MIVVDATVVLHTLLQLPGTRRVEERLFGEGRPLHAPALLDIEVAQAIGGCSKAGRIEAERGRMAIADLADFPLTRHGHDLLLGRIWQLRQSLNAAEAAYVALAEALDATLLTSDRKLAGATGHQARIELI
jgi:predicted nucleic acid-binding protein